MSKISMNGWSCILISIPCLKDWLRKNWYATSLNQWNLLTKIFTLLKKIGERCCCTEALWIKWRRQKSYPQQRRQIFSSVSKNSWWICTCWRMKYTQFFSVKTILWLIMRWNCISKTTILHNLHSSKYSTCSIFLILWNLTDGLKRHNSW